MINIAVCDDEKDTLEVMQSAIRSAFSVRGIDASVDAFPGPYDMLESRKNKLYDLIFLDIQMPFVDGIELGAQLVTFDYRPEIVFVTNAEERVFDAFSVNPFGFIRKSRFLKEISAVIDQYIKKHNKAADPETLIVKTKDGMASYPVTDIIYIEGGKRYQKLYITGRKNNLDAECALSELEAKLANKGFLRVHKGFIVNLRHIRLIRKDNVIVMSQNAEIPISRRKTQDVRTEFLKYHRDNYAL